MFQLLRGKINLTQAIKQNEIMQNKYRKAL